MPATPLADRSIIYFLRWAFVSTVVGVFLAAWLGYSVNGIQGAVSFGLIGSVLAVLEISLSFDNAIVNADRLQHMTPVWRRRFLTWGILIAVFGMRVLFPLIVVAVAAKIGPWQALMLALSQPDDYARIMEDSHIAISAFGGAFLMMVALSYFINERKDVDWIVVLEARLRSLASVRGLQITLVLLVVLGFAMGLDDIATKATYLFAALFGLVIFTCVEVVGHFLDDAGAQSVKRGAATGGAGAFLYLEVLDASFSFDGVIGAFALTQNLLLIAIGLGVGAMYVRSMTIMLVEKQTLSHFKYLEHGAYYSILALSIIMFAQSRLHIPEAVTGLIGASLIAMAFVSSVRARRDSVVEQRTGKPADIGKPG